MDKRNKLLFELIGLVKSIDGNESMIDYSFKSLIIECLYFYNLDYQDLFDDLINRIDLLKRKIVPNCFNCANPCGKTSGYDFTKENDEQILKLKNELLTKVLKDIETEVKDPLNIQISDDKFEQLLKQLFILGMKDCEVEYFKNI